MSPLYHSLTAASTEINSRCWNAVITHLRGIDNIVINQAILDEYNRGTREWPVVFYNRGKTEAGLVTYKGVNLELSLTIARHYLCLRVAFQTATTFGITENDIYHMGRYIGALDESINIGGLSQLKPEEKTGVQLDKSTVLRLFSFRSDKFFDYAFNYYINTECTTEQFIERLEAKYKKYAKSVNTTKLSADEDKIYSRYLKNRYPKVKALLAK